MHACNKWQTIFLDCWQYERIWQLFLDFDYENMNVREADKHIMYAIYYRQVFYNYKQNCYLCIMVQMWENKYSLTEFISVYIYIHRFIGIKIIDIL